MMIDVAVVEFHEGGKTLWVHDSEGSTVLRIQCTGRIKMRDGCENICVHSDMRVQGDIEVCVPNVTAAGC